MTGRQIRVRPFLFNIFQSYVMGAQKSRRKETVLLSTHIILFKFKGKKIIPILRSMFYLIWTWSFDMSSVHSLIAS